MARVEELRARLPLAQYVDMLHQAATTGILPRYTSAGEPEPVDPDAEDDTSDRRLDTSERLELIQYLVNKLMPNIAETAAPEETDHAREKIMEALAHLPVDALKAIVAAPAAASVHLTPTAGDARESLATLPAGAFRFPVP